MTESRDAERVVIGSAMLSADMADQVANVVSVESFGLPAHRAIWSVIRGLRDRGEVAEPLRVAAALDGDLVKVGGAPYLAECVEAVPLIQSAPHYARQVADAAERRRLRVLAEVLRGAAEADAEIRPARLAEIRDALVVDQGTGSATSPLAKLRAALVDTLGLDDIPEPEPLIAEVLYRDSLAWLIGPPGNGKSFVALDFAGSVGTGLSWQTRPVTAGAVLYLIAEGVSGVRPRVRAWETAAGQAMADVHFLPVAVQSANDADWGALVELAVELAPVLIVVDTQARVTTGLDENSARDMGLYVHRIERLRIATRACVLSVHHQGRNGDHMRGSTALEGAATTIIRATKADELITITCAKQKDAPEFEDFTLRLIQTDSSAILALTSTVDSPQRNSAAIRRMLSAWWAAHESDWVSVSVLVKSQVCAEATFHRSKKALVKTGILSTDGAKRAIRYRLNKAPEDL